MEFTIRKLSLEAGVSVDTIRYYEREGLLYPKERNNANYRIYNHDSLQRLNFIRNAKNLGFRLAEVKELLSSGSPATGCSSTLHSLVEKLTELKSEIFDLDCKKEKLEKLIDEYERTKAEDIFDFFSYIENLPAAANQEIGIETHTYLYDMGQWNLKGQLRLDKLDPVGLLGAVNVIHDNRVCRITRDFTLEDGQETEFTIQFHIPIPEKLDLRQKFAADCSAFGSVAGTISFTGNDVFKHYKMQDTGGEGYEHLKRIRPSLYEASGIISDGAKTLVSWNYELERVLHPQ